jgi:signal transduction histidine kinase
MDALLQFATAHLAEEVAHDLVAPTRFFEGLLGLMSERIAPDEDDLAIAKEELARLHRLIAALRALRAPALAPASENLSALVAAARDATAAERARREISWNQRLPLDLAIDADRLVEYVLTSLAQSAVWAAPDGGAIDVTAHAERGEVLLSFSMSHCERELDPPPQSWSAASGTWRDLAIARRIARAHGASVYLPSPGAGASLRVRLRRSMES